MNNRGLLDHMGETKRENFDDLKAEYDAIKRDIDRIKCMEVSEEAKQPILAELQGQINEVKEKMHNYIDRL